MDNQQFSTIDRLVEFGMGVAVAQQMINTMNHCISNMKVPGAGNPMMPPPAPQYYAVVENAQVGPLTEQETQQLVAAGRLHENTLMWTPGATGWAVAKSMPQIHKLLMLNQPR